MIEELERIVLTVDLPDHNLKRGDVGTVVLVHQWLQLSEKAGPASSKGFISEI